LISAAGGIQSADPFYPAEGNKKGIRFSEIHRLYLGA
jgi:hypothetical protein